MPDCNELIISEEARDYIVEQDSSYFKQLTQMEGICLKCVNDTWCLLYTENIAAQEIRIGREGYYSIPKLYGLMDTTSFDESGITATLNQPFLNVRGQGVVIGFVDTGIDYLLDDFQFARGQTKIAAIWDQTIQQEQENLFDYGTVYTREDINRALQAKNAGNDPYEIVPSRDTNGHGTFLAGVAAASRTNTYMGAAPDSELIMVKLKPAKKYLKDFYLINEQAEAYSETDIMAGVRFLQYYAEMENKPLVICIGLGTGSGPRTGGVPLSDFLNYMAKQVNTVVVTCMGNEANNRTHVSGRAVSSTEGSQIEISIGANERGFALEIWADSQDVLSVSITSPSGENIPRVPARLGTSSIFNFLLEQSQVSVDYRVVEKVSGYEVIFMRFVTPAQGIWKVDVYSLTNIAGSYNAWLPLKQFMTGDTFFLQSEPSTTLTEPSAAERVISVGAYNHVTGAVYISSGRGYTANNMVKPDFVAPGVDVYGVKAGGGYTSRTGTSVAAAHTAGAAALLLTWGVFYKNLPYMGTNEVKSILIRGAKRDSNTLYPDNVYGYGKLDLMESFIIIRTT